MVHRGADDGQPQGDGHAALEAMYLDGDVTLVMVHGYHHVELAPQSSPEDGIGGKGTPNVNALGLGRFHSRADDFDFLSAQETAFPVVGVQPGHRQARLSQAQGPQALSGDDDGLLGGDRDYTGWIPMFKDQVAAEILNMLVPNTNAHFIQLTASCMPREDLTIGGLYCHSRAAEKYNGILSSAVYSPIVGPASANVYAVDRNDTHFGDELDAYAKFDYTEDVQFNLIGALFIPGDFFASNNDGKAYSLRGGMKVSF